MTSPPFDPSLLTDIDEVSHLTSPLALGAKVMSPFRVREHQRIINQAVVDAFFGRGPRFVAVSVPQQYGKALALDTPIPIPNGWTTMGELQVGDQVFSEDGSVTIVISATEVMDDRPCYGVRFDTGDVIVADEEHQWKLRVERKRPGVTTIRNSKFIAKPRQVRPLVHNCSPLELPNATLPIDPYVLGVWLGDGDTNGGAITAGDQDRGELQTYLSLAGCELTIQKNRNHFTVRGLKRKLRELGVLNNKHIPTTYLRASVNQRLSLLQGLMDTDGYVPKRGLAEYTTIKPDLADQVHELICSLGMKARIYKGRASLYGRDIGPKYRVCFMGPNIARLRRKLAHSRELVRRTGRFVDAVGIPSVPVRCIQVAHPSGMFLAGRSMIPTHNSQLTSILTPAWVLELHALGILPGGLCGLMSFEDSLSQSWSTKIRRLIEANPDTFNTQLRKDSRAAGYWETDKEGGGVLAIGTGGSVQGRPLTFIGLDDITKNYDQAMSPKHQDKLWDNWNSVIYGRLQPWTVVLVTMIRWAPDDFIGRLQSRDYEGDPDTWRFIRIPLVSEGEGDPLDRPVGEPLLRPQTDQTLEEAYLEAKTIEATVSTYAWGTNWQQSPRDSAGTIFSESKWRFWGGDFPKDAEDERFDLPDDFDTLIFSWDMAFKDERHHDWVVGQLWGASQEDRYLIDQVRGHWGFTECCNRVKMFAQRWRTKYPKARTVLVEDKANGTAIIEVLRSKVGGLVPISPEESKLARAWAVQPLQLGGNLYLPAPSTASWVRAFMKEASDFRGDGSGHDDQVDAMTQALNHLMFYQHEPVTYEDMSDVDLTAIRAPGWR